MRNKKIHLVLNLLVAILLVGCGGVKVNKQVFVKEKGDYTFGTESGNYTYRIDLKPKTGSFSETLIGTTTNDSKLVVYREDVSAEDLQIGVPGQQPPKIKESKIHSYEIKPGAKYETVDSPDESETKFVITIDVTTDVEDDKNQDEEEFFYLVDFKVRKQT